VRLPRSEFKVKAIRTCRGLALAWSRVRGRTPDRRRMPFRSLSDGAARPIKNDYHATMVRFRCQSRLRALRPRGSERLITPMGWSSSATFIRRISHALALSGSRKSCWCLGWCTLAEVRAKFSAVLIIKLTIYWWIAIEHEAGYWMFVEDPQAA
jgi:hypothetical protein